jgi:transposase InsO family protein
MLFGKGFKVKFIRCDNGGENISAALKEICGGGLGSGRFIQLKYTPKNKPQHNGVVERCFATNGQRALAMMLDRNWLEPT